jgi:glycerol transport system ATP-binding protein
VVWPVGAGARGLADGAYTIGLRPHNVSPVRLSETAPAVQARVLVADLSGSESIVHFALAGTTWVSLSHGIHRFEVGATATLYADIDRLLYFGSDGRLVAGGT